ncbi:MAG: hypothetical protein LW847_12555 [Burkholderiales bacterium]|nr:hypothetical protein [Burkholderiales bacterium]
MDAETMRAWPQNHFVAGRNQYVSVEFVHREMIRPLNADKKIELARKISAQLPDELKPDSKLFNSIDAMRTLRNSFAHGAILLQPVGNSVRAYPARDPGTTIDLAFARMVDEQAQWLLQALANWRHVLEPVDGIDVEAVCA